MMKWRAILTVGCLVLNVPAFLQNDHFLEAAPQAAGAQASKGISSKAGAKAAAKAGASPSKEASADEAREQSKASRKTPRMLKREAAANEAREALEEMTRKLGKGEYLEFLHQHSPINEYMQQLRGGNGVTVPLQAIPQLVQLATTLEAMKNSDITMDPSNRVAVFTAKEEVKIEISNPNPYRGEVLAEVGYVGDVEKVIGLALKELKKGNYEDVMKNMMPPSTVMMMQKDGRWDGMIQGLSESSPMIERMTEDLDAIAKLKPEIDGDTAEYRLPSVVTIQGRQPKQEERGERIIRFSRVNGKWRFFDANSKTSQEMDAALERKATGEVSSSQLVIEKIGSDWRLLQTPGMRGAARADRFGR